MNTTARLLVGASLGAGIFLSCVSPATADEVDELINALKPSPVDYAAWAEGLLKAADGLKDRPAVQGRLFEAAYEGGIKQAKGYPVAIRAAREGLKTLNGKPGGRGEERAWEDRLLAACRMDWQAAERTRKAEAGKAYVGAMVEVADGRAEAGETAEAVKLYGQAMGLAGYWSADRKDEIAGKLKAIREQEQTQREVERHKGLLAANAKNTAVREALICLYVVELDAPAEAAKLLTPDVSEKLRTYVPLAAAGVDKAAKEACLELGDWYASLAADATTGGKGIVLAGARDCYSRLLELETDTARRALGQAKLAQVEKDLRGMSLPPGLARKLLTLELGNGVEMKLVRIPAGEFTMGSPESEGGRETDEGPQHEVRITKPFYMGITEVTQQQYAAFIEDNPSRFQGAEIPVEQVTWDEAVEFCKRLSARTRRAVRLPTEAEWEYACRAGTKARYSFGDNAGKLGDYAWFDQNADRKTHPVGQKKPNPAGLYDMHGNVWEWCGDWDGPYNNAKAVDPQGPRTGTARVVRGGSWLRDPGSCRSAARLRGRPGRRYYDIGFRVVVDSR